MNHYSMTLSTFVLWQIQKKIQGSPTWTNLTNKIYTSVNLYLVPLKPSSIKFIYKVLHLKEFYMPRSSIKIKFYSLRNYPWRITNINLSFMNCVLNYTCYWYSKPWSGAYHRFDDSLESAPAQSFASSSPM